MNNRIYTITCPEDQKLLGIVVPTKKLGSDHVRTFQNGLLEVVRDKELSGDDMRVFFGILSQVEYENKFVMSLTALGKKINVSRSNVSKSVKKLVKRGYLTKENSLGQVNFYMVDPRIAIKCRASKFTKVLNHWDDLPQPQH